MSAKIELLPIKRSRVLQGHPWVFANEVKSQPDANMAGESVELYDARNHCLGSGIFNPNSQIIWRRFSMLQRSFDAHFIEEMLEEAIKLRSGDLTCRLVWSECDNIPGLVVDRFNDVLVIQALTLAVDRNLESITKILQKLINPREMVLRNDAGVRKLEGLAQEIRTVSGKPLEPFWCVIEGIEYYIDLMNAQKTGFYLDQRFQAKLLARYAKGRRVLDGFCNQGAFALQAAKAGASSVVAVDVSAQCIQSAQRNAEHNKCNITFHCEDMFDYFGNHKDEKYDMIILDPPPFAKTKSHVPNALSGYKELNLRALKMLSEGGILATYSCSQHITEELFIQMLIEAARDARKTVRLLELTQQPYDHPILLHFPESWYLKGAILQIV